MTERKLGLRGHTCTARKQGKLIANVSEWHYIVNGGCSLVWTNASFLGTGDRKQGTSSFSSIVHGDAIIYL